MVRRGDGRSRPDVQRKNPKSNLTAVGFAGLRNARDAATNTADEFMFDFGNGSLLVEGLTERALQTDVLV
ncbi:hypothetical protein [Acuticoccus sp.]|uniref:hypothetical protein n=1 Tax=Acuticoccus sp. TaxID=1904378 RepID=UPI003B5225E5